MQPRSLTPGKQICAPRTMPNILGAVELLEKIRTPMPGHSCQSSRLLFNGHKRIRDHPSIQAKGMTLRSRWPTETNWKSRKRPSTWQPMPSSSCARESLTLRTRTTSHSSVPILPDGASFTRSWSNSKNYWLSTEFKSPMWTSIVLISSARWIRSDTQKMISCRVSVIESKSSLPWKILF